MSSWRDQRCRRTVVHFATETNHFAIEVRTFQSQPSAAPWFGFNEAAPLRPPHARRAFAALRSLPLLFEILEKFLQMAPCRLRLKLNAALMTSLDTFNPTRELP